MKKLLFLSFVMSSVISLNAQLFQQNFSSSTTVADYINATPGSGQFNAMTADGAAFTKSITNGALRFSKTASASFYLYRNFVLVANPTFVQLKFDFEAVTLGTNTTANNPYLTAVIGSGFSSSSTGTTSNYAARFGFKSGASGGLRAYCMDNTGTAPISSEFTGKQTFTFVINNSGVSQTYTDPNANQETVASGKADIWIGTVKFANEYALKNTDAVKGVISGIKIQSGIAADGNGDFDFDNIEFTDMLAVTTANKDLKSTKNIQIFPNPVAGAAEIRNIPATSTSVKIDLYTINSQLITSKTYSVSNGTVKLDMSNLAEGTYFVKGNAGEPFTVKLIKR